MDNKKLSSSILEKLGGKQNIVQAGHCMTRLRVTVKDSDKVNAQELKELEGVQGVIDKGNEKQIVIGTNVAEVFAEFNRLGNFDQSLENKEINREKENVFNRVIKYISSSIYPILSILTVGALVGALTTLLSTFAGLDTGSGTYRILSTFNTAMFDFLPIFAGFAAAKALNLNGYWGAFLGALLVHSNISGVEGLSFVGIPVTTMTYTSTLIPVLLGVAFMALVDKYIGSRVPQIVSFFLRPFVDLLITLPVTLIVLGPLGGFVGNYLSMALGWIHNTLGGLGLMILGGVSPLLVSVGAHTPLIPLGVQGFMTFGYDGFVLPSMLAANTAIGGAALAVSMKSKKADRKQSASTAALTAIVGITEPALYGTLIPLKKPMLGACIGGALGGLVAGILNVRMFGLNSPGIASLPLFINPDGTSQNLLFACLSIVIAFATGFAVTYVRGFDDDEAAE